MPGSFEWGYVYREVPESLLHQEVTHIGLARFIGRGERSGQDRADQDEGYGCGYPGEGDCHEAIMTGYYGLR